MDSVHALMWINRKPTPVVGRHRRHTHDDILWRGKVCSAFSSPSIELKSGKLNNVHPMTSSEFKWGDFPMSFAFHWPAGPFYLCQEIVQVLGALRGKILAKPGQEPWTPYHANLSMQGIKVYVFVYLYLCLIRSCRRKYSRINLSKIFESLYCSKDYLGIIISNWGKARAVDKDQDRVTKGMITLLNLGITSLSWSMKTTSC